MRKELEEQILQELKSMDGQVGFYYKNLVTGDTLGYHEDEQFLPASIVKLPLLAARLMMRERGETDFRDSITIHKDQKLPGCGVVQHMTGDQNGDVTLDIDSLYKFMIAISDTTATNALYRHYGNDRIIAAFRELGLVGKNVPKKPDQSRGIGRTGTHPAATAGESQNGRETPAWLPDRA